MKIKGLVVFLLVVLIATNGYLSVQLYHANQQIAELTRERDKFMKAAESLAEAMGILEMDRFIPPGKKAD